MGTTEVKIDHFIAQKKIAMLWLIVSFVLFLIFLILSLTKYKEVDSQIWNWFLPNIIPTLSLILGVFVSEFFNSKKNRKQVVLFYFNLTFYMSLCYLMIFFVLIIVDGLDSNLPLTEIIAKSNLYLGPLQGLVTITMGLFFVKGN